MVISIAPTLQIGMRGLMDNLGCKVWDIFGRFMYIECPHGVFIEIEALPDMSDNRHVSPCTLIAYGVFTP